MVKHLRWIGHMPIAVGRTRQVNFKQSIYCWFQLFCFLGAFFFSFFLFLFSIVLFFNFSLKSSGHFNIFVGDLSPEVTDATLFACFSVYPSCSWVPHCFLFFSSLRYFWSLAQDISFFMVTVVVLVSGDKLKIVDVGGTFQQVTQPWKMFWFQEFTFHLLSYYLQWCKGYVGSQNWSVKRIWFCFFPWSSGIAYSVQWNILKRWTNEPSWKGGGGIKSFLSKPQKKKAISPQNKLN